MFLPAYRWSVICLWVPVQSIIINWRIFVTFWIDVVSLFCCSWNVFILLDFEVLKIPCWFDFWELLSRVREKISKKFWMTLANFSSHCIALSSHIFDVFAIFSLSRLQIYSSRIQSVQRGITSKQQTQIISWSEGKFYNIVNLWCFLNNFSGSI